MDGKSKKEETKMKTIAVRFYETAAASLAAILLLTAGATSASAQDFNIRGNIPFAFAVDRYPLEPGNYQIETVYPFRSILKLYNPATHRTVNVPVIDRITTPRDGHARAEFSCTPDACQLVRVFNGVNGYEVVKPKVHPVERERLLAVNLTPESKK
jgi:hypothetical protein